MRESVNVTKILDVPAERVWAAIAGIDGLDRWFPVISACKVDGTGVGAIRLMEVEGGGRIVDRVDEIDHANRRFVYDRTESPFPVTRYVGTVLVNDLATGEAEISWTVEIDVEPAQRDELAAFLATALGDGVDGLGRDLH